MKRIREYELQQTRQTCRTRKGALYRGKEGGVKQIMKALAAAPVLPSNAHPESAFG
jgi:hypothetical protein